MENKKLEFDNAVREVIAMEFIDIPCNEDDIELSLSPEFEARMDALIAKEKNSFWRITNTPRKRLAAILIAIMVLFTTACSVDAIREPVVKFIIEVTETFYDFIFDGQTSDQITYEYKLTPIPDGFEEQSAEITDAAIIRRYIDASGNKIILSQNISDDTTFVLDSEKGTITELKVDNIDVIIYEYDDVMQAIWTSDSYVFYLTCYGDIEIEAIQKLIKSVK